MTFKDELLADESEIFDIDAKAVYVNYTTVKKTVFEDKLAIIDENSIASIMNDGMETNNSNSLIKIPRSLYDEIVVNELDLRGSEIFDKQTKSTWRVQSVLKVNGLYADLICQRNVFLKARPN
jgi:hypothetical protein